jgi:hypothetical protein
MKRFSILLLALMVVVMISCSQNDEQMLFPTEETPSSTIKTGEYGGYVFLKFPDQETFDAHLEMFRSDPIVGFESGFEGYESQNAIFYDMVNDPTADKEYYMDEYAHLFFFDEDGVDFKVRYEPGIQHLINKLGIVQVGNRIKKYTEGKVYVVENGELPSLDLLAQYPEGSAEQAITVYSVSHSIIDLSDNSNEILRPASTDFSQDPSCNNQNGNERVIGQSIITEYGGYDYSLNRSTKTLNVNLRAKNQKRSALWGWNPKTTGALKIEYDMEISGISGSAGTVSVPSGQTSSEISRTVLSHTYYPTVYNTTYSDYIKGLVSGRAKYYGRSNTNCMVGDAVIAPSNISTTYTASTNELCISWDAVTGADSYKLLVSSALQSSTYTVQGTSKCIQVNANDKVSIYTVDYVFESDRIKVFN